jgi:hypothetical protein
VTLGTDHVGMSVSTGDLTSEAVVGKDLVQYAIWCMLNLYTIW